MTLFGQTNIWKYILLYDTKNEYSVNESAQTKSPRPPTRRSLGDLSPKTPNWTLLLHCTVLHSSTPRHWRSLTPFISWALNNSSIPIIFNVLRSTWQKLSLGDFIFGLVFRSVQNSDWAKVKPKSKDFFVRTQSKLQTEWKTELIV